MKLIGLGLSLAIIGCFVNSISLLMMKRSADTEKALPVWKRKWWLFGFALLMANSICMTPAALAIMPLSLMAPLGGLTIVFSTLLAAAGCVGVRERLEALQLAYIGLIVLGVTFVAFFGPRPPENKPTMAQLLHNFVHPPFVATTAIGGTIVLTFVTTQHTRCLPRLRLPAGSPALTAGDGFTAAACGALSQMFLKIIAHAIASTFWPVKNESHSHPWRSAVVWVSLVGLATSAPLQLVLLNKTLASSPVNYAVPLYQSLLIILTITTGGTFFHEFADLAYVYAALFGLGVTVAMIGLAALTLSRNRAAKATEVKKGPDEKSPLNAQEGTKTVRPV